MTTILIGTEEGDHLKIEVTRWLIEDPENDVDAGWLATEVDLAASPFRGRYSIDLRAEDLLGLRDGIAQLHEEFRAGEAAYAPTLSTPLRFTVRVSNTGSLECTGTAIAHVGERNEQRLDFYVDAASTTLAELLHSLNGLAQAYPRRAAG